MKLPNDDLACSIHKPYCLPAECFTFLQCELQSIKGLHSGVNKLSISLNSSHAETQSRKRKGLNSVHPGFRHSVIFLAETKFGQQP